MANVSEDVIKNEVYDEEHNVESDLDISDIEDVDFTEDDTTGDDVTEDDVEEEDDDESGSSDETADSASDKEAEDDDTVKPATEKPATVKWSTFREVLDNGLELDESYMVSVNIFVAVFIAFLIPPTFFIDPDYGSLLIWLSMTVLAFAYNNIYYTPSISNTNLKLD